MPGTSGTYSEEVDSAKQQARELVLQHMLNNHTSKQMKFFGLPSTNWTFENMLIKHLRCKFHIVGVEREKDLYRRSSCLMPGRPENFITLPLQGKPKLEVTSTPLATLYNVELKRFVTDAFALTALNPCVQPTLGWNAIWLDICGTVDILCDILPRLGYCLEGKAKKIPLAITFATNRGTMKELNKIGSEDTFEKRCLYIEQCLDKLPEWKATAIENYKYRASTGSSNYMGLSLMVLKPK